MKCAYCLLLKPNMSREYEIKNMCIFFSHSNEKFIARAPFHILFFLK